MTRSRPAVSRCGRPVGRRPRGDLDEAHQLYGRAADLFEQADAARDVAIARGGIADVLYRRGELDEARTLQELRLAVNRQLSNIDGITATLWSLAQFDIAAEDWQAAAPRLTKAWGLLERLGRVQGIAIVGNLLGQLLWLLTTTTPLRCLVEASPRIGGWKTRDRQEISSVASLSCEQRKHGSALRPGSHGRLILDHPPASETISGP